NHPVPTDILTLSLHDALPIWPSSCGCRRQCADSHRLNQKRPSEKSGGLFSFVSRSTKKAAGCLRRLSSCIDVAENYPAKWIVLRSEEHTSELQSRENLVCRLL